MPPPPSTPRQQTTNIRRSAGNLKKRGTRRARGGNRSDNMTGEEVTTEDNQTTGTAGTESEDDNNRRRPSLDSQTTAVMNAFVDRLAATGLTGMQREFAELKAFLPPNRAATAFDANRMRNRYTDQVCYDATRVKLTYNVPPELDYIHANFVDIPGLGNRFICTQGPLPDTVNDFWRMIFQEKPVCIVKLCHFEEDGKPKCAQYYPVNEGEVKEYGYLVVRHVKTDLNFDRAFDCINLEVGEKNSPSTLKIQLYAWKTWPDKRVPPSGFGVLRLLRAIRRFLNGNIVVHCSAGVGRTGTVVALAILVAKLLDHKPFSVYEVVKDLRCRRHNSVQTEAQYLFIHRTLCEYIQTKGLQRPQLTQFMADYATYMKNLAANPPLQPAGASVAQPQRPQPQQNTIIQSIAQPGIMGSQP
ncbi:hypothetical protein M3Y98_00163800 [Aphelenchoides besseyi]|nr:hypothetical protein M3Y98_00163800 [Aphelenchoides besseyi]